ncbi:YceI family protein [Flavobacterium sp.]|uniref:YceI family protein n=1 Tax=Flavobacterium sp. TaxID=239 RepID=UPI003D0E4689
MKTILITLLLLTTKICYSQNKTFTKEGIISFEASVPSFEEVKATTNTGICALNPKTGDIAAVILIKNFKFKNSLMQEHFNENYMESDRYPKGVFKGKIDNFQPDSYSNTTKITINGIFEIHGKSKNMIIPATLKKEGNSYSINAEFILKPEDFSIEIPSIVGYKIAKTVSITSHFNLISQ